LLKELMGIYNKCVIIPNEIYLKIKTLSKTCSKTCSKVKISNKKAGIKNRLNLLYLLILHLVGTAGFEPATP